MPIEGPLRELGIHDVFQLLDLSRKTGVLRVSSELREDEGVVFFDKGRVVQAAIRSTAVPTEIALLQAGRVSEADLAKARARQANGRGSADIVDVLLDMGAITNKEIERQLRLQIENVVFELMSWREGFFSFEERARADMPAAPRITVSTESLLMEGARRIDEWSRIADIVPNVQVVPELAPITEDREGAMLDLLPHEWQVLTMIDGARDLRAIAASLRRDEFEIAKIAYGLATTGIVTVRSAVARHVADSDGSAVDVHVAAARAHTRVGRHLDALDALRHAVQEDPTTPDLHLRCGFAAARAGDLAAARASWEHVLRLAAGEPAARAACEALEALAALQQVLDRHVDD
jgi:hypothetical protein